MNISQYTFKDFIQKFKPSEVWSEMEKSNQQKGLNRTLRDEFTTLYNRMDATDELLNLTVKNGNPKIILNKDGRRWKPPADLVPSSYDKFTIRRRLVELMKQIIYQTRNKMVLMQHMRKKYNTRTLYKMGFLMSKTDTLCNTINSFATKAYKACTLVRMDTVIHYPLSDMMSAVERLLDLWFDLDLLVDLLSANHHKCKLLLEDANATRKEAWKFID